MLRQLTLAAAAVACISLSHVSASADPTTLAPQTAITVPGPSGSFDWMASDGRQHKIYAAHPGCKGVAIIDTTANTATELDLGGSCNGIAIDRKHDKLYFAGGNQAVLVYDRTTLAKKSEIALDGPADTIAIDPKNGMLYVDNDDGKKIWVVDTATDKITGTVDIADAPEYVAYDSTTDKLYQNIKPANEVQVIDPAKNVVTATWSTLPATSPHGLAVDGKHNRLFSGGKNSLLVEMDMTTGKVTSQCEIAPGVDQLAYDGRAQRVYCAGDGFISVASVTDKGLTLLEKVPVAKKTHTLALDPANHQLWISYSDGEKSMVQAFKYLGVPTEDASSKDTTAKDSTTKDATATK